MKGSLQVKYGTWYTVISYKGTDGKYKKKWEATGLKERGNKKEAQKLLDERLQQFEEAQKQQKEKYALRAKSSKEPLGNADMRFVDYCKAYVESIKSRLSPYIYYMYKVYHLKRFGEYFQDKTVIDITSDEVDAFNECMRKERGLSNSTLKHFETILKPALRIAFEDKIIPDNPYIKTKRITIEKPIIDFYNEEELDKLFKVIKGNKLELAIKMLAHYGFRRSELIGLRWKAVDFEHDMITINHKVIMVERQLHLEDKLKTKTSHRSLPIIPHIKNDLLKWKKQVAQNRIFFGNSYNDKWEDYIFVDEKGGLIQPSYVTHTFNKLLKKHNLKHIRLHDLRHSCASLLLANNINMKQIQDWLGHAKFSTTADTYSHLDYNSKIQSANVLTTIFGKNKQPEPNFNEDKNLLEKIKKDMKRLGFDNFNEYSAYLDEQLEGANDDKIME